MAFVDQQLRLFRENIRMGLMKRKLFGFLYLFYLVVGVLFSASTVYGDCSCLRGSNDIYSIGLEFVANSCPNTPYSDDDGYNYAYSEVECSGSMSIPGLVTSLVLIDLNGPWKPGEMINSYASSGHKVIRNHSGTHIIMIRNDSNPLNRFSGTIAGVNIVWSDNDDVDDNIYETDPEDKFNEYCSGFFYTGSLFVLDTDKFPDCLDCVPDDPNYGVCLKEENNLGPCPEPPQSGINTSL